MAVVQLAPKEVGPCTATWFIGLSGPGVGDANPSFSFPSIAFPSAAFGYLVDGPLKDVLAATYATATDFMQAWAEAGGQVDIAIRSEANDFIYGASAVPDAVASTPVWYLGYPVAINPVGDPLWVVKFSVPHSIIK